MSEETKKRKRQYGTGTAVQKLPSGNFQQRVRKDGQRRLFTAETREELKAAIDGWKPVAHTYENPLLGVYLRQWWDEASPKWTASTRASDAHRFNKYIIADAILCATNIKSLSKLDVKRWLGRAFGGASENTKNVTLSILCRALSAAVKDDYIQVNVAERGGLSNAPQKSKSEIKPFTRDEMNILISSVKGDPKWEPLLLFAFDSGFRQAEIFGLQFRDFNFKTGTVKVQRTVDTIAGEATVKDGGKSKNARREILLSKRTLEAVEALCKNLSKEQHVFTDGDGQLWTRHKFRKAFAKVTKQAGVPDLGLHSCRHTCASLLVSKVQSITSIAYRMGHSDAAITLRIYGHNYPSDQHLLADAFDELFAY
jgi:integrase